MINIGNKNSADIKSTSPSINPDASGRDIFFASLSTTGLSEQAITYYAKNSIAISLILVMKIINKIAMIKNIIFFAEIYFLKISNIIAPSCFY